MTVKICPGKRYDWFIIVSGVKADLYIKALHLLTQKPSIPSLSLLRCPYTHKRSSNLLENSRAMVTNRLYEAQKEKSTPC